MGDTKKRPKMHKKSENQNLKKPLLLKGAVLNNVFHRAKNQNLAQLYYCKTCCYPNFLQAKLFSSATYQNND